MHNILAQTIGALPSEHATPAPPRGEGWLDRLKARLAPIFAPVATPRFAMSFGMAFFSITMLLGIAGFHMSDLRHWDLSSKGIMKTYYDDRGARASGITKTCAWFTRLSRRSTISSGPRARQTVRSSTTAAAGGSATSPKNSPKSELRRDVKPQTPNSSQEHGQPKLAASPAVVPVANPQARRQGSHPVNSMGTLNRRLV